MLTRFRSLFILSSFVILLSTLSAAPPERLTGTVKDAMGAVLPNAYIVIHPDPAGMMNGDPRKTITARSDKSGAFDAEVESGFYDVCVMAMAFTPECKKIRVQQGHSMKVGFWLKVSTLVTSELGDTFAQ